MAEIEFRFPSVIPYAYVSWRGTEEEAARLNPEMLATLYANTLNAFQAAEEAAARAIAQGGAVPGPSKIGDTVMVAGMEFTKHSETPFADAAEAVRQGLGATEIQDVNEAPWKAPQKPAKKEPWETSKPKAVAAVDLEDW